MMKRNLIAVAALAAIALAAVFAPQKSQLVPDAQAATPNVAISNPGVMLVPLQFSGSYTTTTTVGKFNMPMPCSMVGVGATARAAGGAGTNLDVQLGGVSILSTPILLSTGSYVEGTISTAAITDEGVITVILGAPVTSGPITDTTVVMTCVRK
jgi:hypothetical protein